MNPFELTGPAFLAFHAAVWIVGLGLAVMLRRHFLQPNDLGPEEPALHPYEVAHLAGGATLAVNAAILRLVDSKHLLHDATTDKFTRNPEMGGQSPSRPHPADSAILGLPGEITVKEAREACAAEMGTMRNRLQEMGLELPPESASKARWWPALIMLALLAFGLVKLTMGVGRGKPVAYLAITSVVTLIVALIFALRRSVRTGRGDQLLDALKARHDALRVAAGRPAGTLSSEDLPLAVGLFGAGVLAGAGYLHLRRALQPPTSAGGGGYYSDTGGGCGGGCGGGDWGTSDSGGGGDWGGGDSGGGDAGGGDGGGGGGCGGGSGCGGCGGGGGD